MKTGHYKPLLMSCKTIIPACVCPRQVKVGQLNFNLMEFSHETIPLHALQIYLLTIIISCHYTMTTYGNVSHNVHNRFFYAKGQEHR